MTSHYLSLAWILEHQVDYFIFDYQGYGISPGTPSQRKTVDDGAGAISWAQDYLRKNHWESKTPLVILAQSLGGAVALRGLTELSVEAKQQVRLVLLDSTFIEYTDATRSVLSQHWLTWPFQWLGEIVISDKFSAKGLLNELPQAATYVVMHGDHDRTIDYSLGEDLFNRLPTNNKAFWKVSGGTHTSGFWQKNPEFRTKFLNAIEGVSSHGIKLE